jgi:hypothetical protein
MLSMPQSTYRTERNFQPRHISKTADKIKTKDTDWIHKTYKRKWKQCGHFKDYTKRKKPGNSVDRSLYISIRRD